MTEHLPGGTDDKDRAPAGFVHYDYLLPDEKALLHRAIRHELSLREAEEAIIRLLWEKAASSRREHCASPY